jgi:maltose O-acetyltransferase
MKSELEKCLAGEPFNSSCAEMMQIIHQARKLTQEYNQSDNKDTATRQRLLEELFGQKGTNVHVDTPFYCDYGRHTFIGNNVIIGMNCTFVDCNKISIGDNVLIASNVQIYTATHSPEPKERLVENWHPNMEVPYFRTYALPVVIEDNVWIGGGVIILPGVTIGKNAVIGAGSVVTKNIPSDSVAVGNPCRVIRVNNPAEG